MRHALKVARPLASLMRRQTLSPKERARGMTIKHRGKNLRAAGSAARLTLCMVLVLAGFVFAPPSDAQTRNNIPAATPPAAVTPAPPAQGGGTYQPTRVPIKSFAAINVRQAARQEALSPVPEGPAELKAIDAPKGRPDWFEHRGRPQPGGGGDDMVTLESAETPLAPPPSAQGSSPGPSKAFRGEFLSGSSIPPDTMGAVGPNHIVTVSNNQMNFRTRNGVIITRLTLNAFWAGVTLEGGITTPATFDPKIFYDRFNDKYFFFTSANSVSPASSVLFAVTNTNDPTGTWTRYVFDTDPTATGGPTGTGKWADYPTIGFNKNWIVAQYNVFNYSGTATTGYFGPYVYAIDKSAAYTNTLSTVTLFQDSAANCTGTGETILGCGFTMAPTVAEDNTSETLYLIEDWFSTFGQLRLSKITGTAAAPVLTVGTQIPQAPFGWRFNAARIGTTGGYLTQRDQLTYAPSATTRVMANDSRLNNAVLRNGTLWTSHHIMVGAVPNAVPATFGVANPDIRTAVQWWQIDPTIEPAQLVDPITGLGGTPPIQRARIEDPTADNCNSGNSIGNSAERAACTKVGYHFAFAGISVNQNNDMLVGFSQFSSLTFPSAAYAVRLAADPANTTRDVVVYYPGKSNYNIGAGAGATRQNRWGDYSASQTDPVNDTDFWTVQEYSGTRLNFGIGTAAPWETAWALVKPNSTQPSKTGNLIISEFRLRGPQGPNDEFIELYNPSTTTPVRVTSVDASEGWALAWNNGTTTTGLTVVPEGTVVPPRGRLLVPNSPVSDASGLTVATTYGLSGYPSETAPGTPPGVVRTADGDVGYSVDVADNAGVALFKSSNSATGFIAGNQADAAGFAGAGTTFREGTGIPAITAGAVTGQISFHRNQSSGAPQDTGDNAADFIFTNTLATTETLGGTPLLGAAGPENLNSPLINTNIFVDRLDLSQGISNPPNRFRDLTPVTNGTLGTIAFRRRVTNFTSQPLTRLRFRIRQITTAPAPPGVADLRALTSGDITVNSLPVKGTTVEEPPTQTNGGGWNTSWTVDLATPIAPGATVSVQYVCGVMQGGSFSIFINVEALP